MSPPSINKSEKRNEPTPHSLRNPDSPTRPRNHLREKPDAPSRLLLVEDEALIALSEQMELERYGYQVVVAGTGEAALEICNSDTAIDLILMDIDLGAGMSGPETAIQILKTHQVPVLFLSSHTEPEVIAQTERTSAYGYVGKSFGISVLDVSIKQALRLFHSNVRLPAIAKTAI